MSGIPTQTLCHECNRGGNGNYANKCASGWSITEQSTLGCLLGTPIVGTPRAKPRMTMSQKRYQQYLRVADIYDNFRQFLCDVEHNRQKGDA